MVLLEVAVEIVLGVVKIDIVLLMFFNDEDNDEDLKPPAPQDITKI